MFTYYKTRTVVVEGASENQGDGGAFENHLSLIFSEVFIDRGVGVLL